MDPNTNPPQETPTAAPPAEETPQEDLIPKSKVEQIVRDRLERDRKTRSKQEPVAPAPREEPKPSDPGYAELKAKLDFAEALDELDWKPSKDDREHLRDAFNKGTEAMLKLAVRLKPPGTTTPPAAAAPTEPPAPTGPGYKSPGAPAGAPPEVLDRDATKWSKDYIERLRENGTFLQELDKFRGSLPGGGNGVFRKRIPTK